MSTVSGPSEAEKLDHMINSYGRLQVRFAAVERELALLREFISAAVQQATPGTDYYCPRCDHHDPDLDGRLILDKQDSRELRERVKDGS